MNVVDILFLAFSALAIFSGWRVFRTDSMVRASFLLLVSFIAVGAIMILLAAAYVGFAAIFMMAVEMMVMALFMVMFMMNPAGLNPMQMVHQHKVSIAAGAIVFVVIVAAAIASKLPYAPIPAGKPAIRDLGTELLGPSMLVFETAGVTLLATMIAAVILSSHSGRYGEATEDSTPPGLEPGGPPAGASLNEDEEK